MNGANQKKWEVAAGVVYVALFLYVCVLRPAPEQRLSSAVAVEANPAAVAALLKGEMRWQVRGGLLGSMLDNVLARTARQELLSDCLGRLRSRAELATKAQRHNAPQRISS